MKRKLYNEQDIRNEVFSLFDVKPMVPCPTTFPKEVQIGTRVIKTRRGKDDDNVAIGASHRRSAENEECAQASLRVEPRLFSPVGILHQVKQNLKHSCDHEERDFEHKNYQNIKIDVNQIAHHDHSKPPISTSKTAQIDSFPCRSPSEVDAALSKVD